MIEAAIKHADELREKMQDIWFKEKYKYYQFTTYYEDFEVDSSTWDSHQFVSMDHYGEVIGYISYRVNRTANHCYGFGAINFTDNKIVFGADLGRVLKDVFEKFNFNKLKFSVVIGNPAERQYDKMTERYGGRILGTEKDETRLIDGKLYDVKQYEITMEEYFRARGSRRTERSEEKIENGVLRN